MTREEAIRLLKGGPEGVQEWNRRRENDTSRLDLCGADFSNTTITQAVLSNVDLASANFSGANLRSIELVDCDMSSVSLIRANIGMLIAVNTCFRKTLFDGATIESSAVASCDMSETSFILAKLHRVNVQDTEMGHSVFSEALLDVRFNCVRNLDEAMHAAPSQLSIGTLRSFENSLPEKFLRGCGLTDEEIAYYRNQLLKPIRYYTCFISCSSVDEEFADRLYNDFQGAGIRCWKWDEDAKTGESLWGEIDQAIRKHEKLVLIASESSLKSPAVCREIERSLRLEDERLKRKERGEFEGNTNVLFPIRLDGYIEEGWQHERKDDVLTKVVADARNWHDPKIYAALRDKLIADLKA